MSVRIRLIGIGLGGVLLVLCLITVKHKTEPLSPGLARTSSEVLPHDKLVSNAQTAGNSVGNPPANLIRVNAGAILATVNARKITLADLIPLGPSETNQDRELSPETYHYLLDRAIKRELIFQTAKAQGVELNESQTQQLADYRVERKLLGPGLVQQLNTDPQQLPFESQDQAAFMLQTELLAQQGSSPNVSEGEVQTYYTQHAGEFADLPADEPARDQAWATISYQIRTLLAPGKRSQFQTEVAAYMDQLESGAQINIAASP